MDWSKAKTWLIILFLCVNVFLIVYLVNMNLNASFIDNETIQNTIEVLNRNDVSIDASLIPARIPSIGTLEVTNALEDPEELARLLMGNGYSVSSSGRIYTKDEKRLAFAGDMIYYFNDAPAERLEGLTQQEAEQTAKDRLSGYGFDMSRAKASTTRQEDGSYTVRLEQTVDSVTLFDSYFQVQIGEDGIREFEGSWFIPSGKSDFFERDATMVKLVTSVLIDFLSDPERPTDRALTIVDIALGYTTGAKDTFHKEVTAMPVWRITTDDGAAYLYDAR